MLNPWLLNEMSAQLSYVPLTDTEYFAKYVVKLNDPNAPEMPGAVHPMAFRPFRTARTHNAQSLFYTVHGNSETPLEGVTFSQKRPVAFMTGLVIDGAQKRVIMKELHNLGITRANLFPGAASLVRTLTYRYSQDYLSTQL